MVTSGDNTRDKDVSAPSLEMEDNKRSKKEKNKETFPTLPGKELSSSHTIPIGQCLGVSLLEASMPFGELRFRSRSLAPRQLLTELTEP
ncbi:Hypothetical predicted protein [Octopus vulgaris]|uniref:Uncharacterized protein n=1 Tax=Octopus vulgaris TaxID=6645 RepID=A0AA36APP5_OCTVU|nr:Hypothetical predicted protein [Octopus vulgaris]